jgi:hypothetical protein
MATMSTLSKEEIVRRVKKFAELVKDGKFGFQTERDWWFVSGPDNVKEGILFLDQLGILPVDMQKHFKSLGTKLGVDHFADLFRRDTIGKSAFVTVRTSPGFIGNTSAQYGNIVGVISDDEIHTRSKDNWKQLLAAISPTASTSSAFPTETENKSSSKKNSFVDAIEDIMYGESTNILDTDMDVLEPETSIRDDGNTEYPEFTVNDIYIMNYWYSSEAGKIFGTLPEEKSALEAIQNQISSLSEAIETADGFKTISVGSDKERIPKNTVSSKAKDKRSFP